MWEGWEETPPAPQMWPCAHCGRACGDAEGGFGSYNGFMLCYPQITDARPNCYHLVAMEHHHVPCDKEGCWVGGHEQRDPV
jgi:hypothetical protein